MVESGDFVDIRFQDEVRYKKPVGIYWMQAAVVETARSARPAAGAGAHLALSHSVADRRDRRGAPDLLGGAAFVTRRGAVLAALMMCAFVLLGVEARLAKTDAMLLLTVVAAMGAMARVYLSWQRGEDPEHPPWSWPAIFWTALALGILLKGPLILMDGEQRPGQVLVGGGRTWLRPPGACWASCARGPLGGHRRTGRERYRSDEVAV